MKMNKTVVASAVLAGLVVASGAVHAADLGAYAGWGLAAGDGGTSQQLTVGTGIGSVGERDTITFATDARLLSADAKHNRVGNVGLSAFLSTDSSVTPYIRVSGGGTGAGVGMGAVAPIGAGFYLNSEVAGYNNSQVRGMLSFSVIRHF
ncbi:hypothetical protein MIZ01_1600 [Sideroxyarcus emersonii]|uniref:Outer membrane protein beta-barrel domain-containing protein n=1 Tax=Sideroxyarcus emersonii TaxID=2764705 RepID=A0AAN2BZ37_9PROT|nr:hypothetical protein [Sideroxyarcus emersonii]BCK87804.1 hypothetical protein MIZ01_1600 [Sideroxyarcus emersonii]